MNTIKLLVALALSTWLAAGPPVPRPQQAAPADYEALKGEAEALFAEGSYARALELYERAGGLDLDEAESRWVRFRTADCRWRSAAATRRADTSELDRAHGVLQDLVRDVRPEDRDLVWAEAQESLGDYHWRRDAQNFSAAWRHFSQALEHWATSSELDLARERYLNIVRRAARTPGGQRGGGWSSHTLSIPREVVRNVLEIAASDADRAWARFMLGLLDTNTGRTRNGLRGLEELERVLAFGKQGEAGEWYDDALFQSAAFLENHGRPELGEDGTETWRPDYVGAAELYRRLLRELAQGESAYRRQAQNRLRGITSPQLGVQVERFFLPGSEVPYRVSWRNVSAVELALYPIDLTRHPVLGKDLDANWLEAIPLELLEPARGWTLDTEDTGEHRPGGRETRLEDRPAAGAYVLRARAGGLEDRALVLVSDAALTVKATGRRLLAWLTDVRTGEPLGEAHLKLWQRYHDGSDWRRRELTSTTAADGTRLFELENEASNTEYFLAARHGDSQAFVQGNGWSRDFGSRGWRLYAHTDRPAYRPGDRVHWKVITRDRRDEGYRTPAGETLAWELRDPRGNVAARGQGELNAFGTLWGELETTADMPLGEYSVSFERVHQRGRDRVGQATLFRLEEYKLPEYEVTVETLAGEEGEPRVFVLGDEVSFDVAGAYYFGGPVAGAQVEVFVYQRPSYRVFRRPRDFPWLYEEEGARHWWGGPGQQVLHETLRTDAEGRARLSFDTPVGGNQDLEYTIEARMVDASRREVVGRRTVRVTQREYEVLLSTEHVIHRPGGEVELAVEARDANDAPVSVEGRLRVLRERWVEAWTDPSGRRVAGTELARLRREGPIPPPGEDGWRCVFSGYEKEPVAETTVRTDEEGRATWRFRPERDGHYRVTWSSRDSRGAPVRAETRIFVADDDTRELGYASGGVEIVVDRDTFVEGEDAAVLLLADASGRWALFTVEAGEILHHEVVRLEGTARLLRLPIDASHVPNVWLTATSVFDGRAHQDREEVVVPPVKNFLDVDVAFAEPSFEPGSEGELAVTVRDHEGQPVRTELSFAVRDDALAYVQQDLAGDPRRFFYGERRYLGVNTRGSFDHGGFVLYDQQKLDGDDVARETSSEGWFLGQGQAGRRDELRALGYAGNAPAAAKSMAPMEEAADEYKGPGDTVPPGGGGAVRVRSDFRDTALWLPDVTTDADGRASVRVPFPDSTTRWKAVVRGADRGARFGSGEASARTRLPLIARLQTPRFFQVGDRCVVSANVNNNTDAELEARVTLSVTGLQLLGRLVADELVPPSEPIVVRVPAGGSTRVDWSVDVREPGEATLELAALAGELGDAMRRTLPVHPHGIEAFEALAGKLTGDELLATLDLPRRADGSTYFQVQLTPSLAVTMLDALPYLVDYPYGCTEQTLSRFLPGAIVARTLRDQGLSPEDAMTRVFGGIEQEFVDRTHPRGKQALAELDRMTAQGLARLYDFQHADGGWGWWKHGDSDPYMTAYVVWGLSLGRDAGLDVRQGVLEDGARWLALHVVEMERRPDMAAWMLHALAAYGDSVRHEDADAFVARAFDRLWAQRDQLNAYTRALFTLAAVGFDRGEEAQVLARNLANGAEIDRTPDTSMVAKGEGQSRPYVLATAHWGQERSWWRWSDGAVESTAFVLRALLAVDPESELVEPTMNWLVKNRRGAQWSNTRDTAICVLALNDYLRRSGELTTTGTFEVLVNGESVAELRVTPASVLGAPSLVSVDEALLRDGPNEVLLRRTAGDGELYFAVHARFFSLEEPIPARGNEVFVRRDYYQLVGRPTLLSGTVFERIPLRDGDTVESGTRIEVVVTVEAKNDLEYVVFEDLKPAGFEAVGVRSGEAFFAHELRRDAAQERFASDDAAEAERRRRGSDRTGLTPDSGGPDTGRTGRRRWAHQELRDRNVAVFLDRLPQGFWEMRYDLRAETPGTFHALPLQAHAMYVPEIRANGEELRVEVGETR